MTMVVAMLMSIIDGCESQGDVDVVDADGDARNFHGDAGNPVDDFDGSEDGV